MTPGTRRAIASIVVGAISSLVAVRMGWMEAETVYHWAAVVGWAGAIINGERWADARRNASARLAKERDLIRSVESRRP